MNPPPGRGSETIRAVVTLCAFGLGIAAFSYCHFASSRFEHAIYEFATRHPGPLVPVACDMAYGDPGADHLKVSVPQMTNSGPRASMVDACWFPLDRYVRIYRIDENVPEAVALQFAALDVAPLDATPTEVRTWPLLGVVLGLFIFVTGAYVPFAGSRRKPEDDIKTEPAANPDALRAELARLRNNLGGTTTSR